jgi:hypothetical protein
MVEKVEFLEEKIVVFWETIKFIYIKIVDLTKNV